MAKKTQLDKAIESLEGEIAILQAAVGKLKAQQKQALVRRPRAVVQAG